MRFCWNQALMRVMWKGLHRFLIVLIWDKYILIRMLHMLNTISMSIPVRLWTKWLHKSFCRLYQILHLGNKSAELKLQIHLGRIFFLFSHFLHSQVQTRSIIYFCLLFSVYLLILSIIFHHEMEYSSMFNFPEDFALLCGD